MIINSSRGVKVLLDRNERRKRIQQKVQQMREKEEKEEYKQIADEYCEELVMKETIVVLKEHESDALYEKLSNYYPFDFSGSGRIEWSQMGTKLIVENAEELAIFMKNHGFEESQVYLLKKFSTIFGSTPVIKTVIENVIESFDNILDEEQFIFCPTKGYVIDIPFSGIVSVGMKK
jgi:hypothetical protein